MFTEKPGSFSMPKKPHIRKLLLNLITLLVILVASTLAVVTLMHNYASSLIETSQSRLLPTIHDHQRAALNLERLERMGDLVVYGGSVSLVRKNALAAQVLAYQPSFDFNPGVKRTVQSAFELLREVRKTRQQILSTPRESLSSVEYQNLVQLEKTLQIRWGEFKHELFKQQNTIISDATSLQTKNMRQITDANTLMVAVTSSAISLLLLAVVFVGFRLYRHLITPVLETSEALNQLKHHLRPSQLTEARYEELNQIRGAVNNFSDTMNKLHIMATQDALTKCANRGYFIDQAQQVLGDAHRNNQPFALLMLDVDHFKKVNDQYGHATGDSTLQLASQWMRSSIPAEGFVGRLGGEEFAIVLPNHNLEQAAHSGEEIRRAIEQLSRDSSNIPAITVSIGVQVSRQPTDGIDNLLSQADKALYQAKAAGRNQVVLFEQTIETTEEALKPGTESQKAHRTPSLADSDNVPKYSEKSLH